MKRLEKLQNDFSKAIIELVLDNSAAERKKLVGSLAPDVTEEIWEVYKKGCAKVQQQFPTPLFGNMNAASRIDYAEQYKKRIFDALASSHLCDALNVEQIYDQLEVRKLALSAVDRFIGAKATNKNPDINDEMDSLKVRLPQDKYDLMVNHLISLENRYFRNEAQQKPIRTAAARSVANAWLQQNRGYKSYVQNRADTNSIPLDLEGSMPDPDQVKAMLEDRIVLLLLQDETPAGSVSSGWGTTDFSRLMADNIFQDWLQRKLAEDISPTVAVKMP